MKKYFVIRGRTIVLLNVYKESRGVYPWETWCEFLPGNVMKHADFVIDASESRFVKNRTGECDIGFFKLDDAFEHIKNFYSDLSIDICYKFYKIYDLDYRYFEEVKTLTDDIVKRLNFGVNENVELRNYNDY